MIVTLDDVTAAVPGSKPVFCRKGIRVFCEKYGLDYADFRNNGIDAQILINIGDSMGLKAVEVARGRIK